MKFTPIRNFYSQIINGRVIISFLFVYIVMLLFGIIGKLFLFSFGSGDIFFEAFNFLKDGLTGGPFAPVFNSLLSYVMFLGSFYGVLILPLIYLFMLSVYGIVIQVVLHIVSKGPKRMSVTMTLLYTVTAFLYPFKFIPVIGGTLFSLLFVYLFGKELAVRNSFSVSKGIFIAIAPSIIVMLIVGVTLLSLLGFVPLF